MDANDQPGKRVLDKKSAKLILYLEARAVDYGGSINEEHLRPGDADLLTEWDREGYIVLSPLLPHEWSRGVKRRATITVQVVRDAHHLRWRLVQKFQGERAAT